MSMRRSLALVALLAATASCGRQQPDQSGSDQRAPSAPLTSYDADSSSAQERAAAGPNVSPTAAPGVAFNYRYAFRLPAQRVAEVQEQHAAACEALGIDRCRITGMHYEVLNERDIRGRLNLALDPAIARRVGREGVAAVLRAEGSLVESEISGTDVGTGIRRAGQNIEQMGEQLRRIEARLAAGGVRPDERSRLQSEAEQLRAAIRAAQAHRQDAQESLATTPMAFVYGSGDLVPGSDGRRPIGTVLRDAGENFLGGATILLIILVTLAPWALLALFAWLLVRWFRRRYVRPAAAPEATAAAEPAA
jgi:hypothetical protein